ncbi:hypothetical protein J6590_100254 [Homalodisca vitripennis]|nr:hypothetical protein J6590_100254 [Homalodisca vitripennis]
MEFIKSSVEGAHIDMSQSKIAPSYCPLKWNYAFRTCLRSESPGDWQWLTRPVSKLTTKPFGSHRIEMLLAQFLETEIFQEVNSCISNVSRR